MGQSSDTLKSEDILKMSFEDLMNIKVVSATKTSQTIQEAPASVFVITAEQINERGYFTLEEALSDLPGIQFRNISGFNSYIFMRGAPSQNNLILLLVDGIRINELNSGGFYAGGQYNMSDIEQIEVVYGPASALYGTNAVSGIINIITKSADKQEGQLNVSGGNFNTGMANFIVSKYNTEKDLGIKLSGQYKTTEKADLGGDAGDNNWSDTMENFENDISIATKIKYKDISSGIIYLEKISSTTTNFKTVGGSLLDRNSKWDIFFLNAFIKYTNEHHEHWSLNSDIYYRNATVKPNTIYQVIKADNLSPGYQLGYYRPNNLVGVENQFNYHPADPLTIVTGLVAESEMLADGFSKSYSNSQNEMPPPPSEPDMLKNYIFSYYFQVNYMLKNAFSMVGGMRQDFSNYYGNVLIPRVGIVYNNNNLTAKALYNTAYRSPKPWDYTYGTMNPDLMPEKMQSVEFSIASAIKKNIALGGSVFNNLINNKLTIERTDLTERWVNKDRLHTFGFEGYINMYREDFKFYANYSFNDSRDQFEMFIPEISKHTANLGFSQKLFDQIIINVRANYLGGRTNPTIIQSTGDDIIDDALIFNSNLLVKAHENLTFQLKVNNLFNAIYYHTSNRFEGRYRQPQRMILLIVSYKFRTNKFAE